MSHIIKVFVEDNHLVKIDHDTNRPDSPKPATHLSVARFQKVRWFNDDDNEGVLDVHFDVSPFDPPVQDFTADPGHMTKQGTVKKGMPDPETGGNPEFPYTISVGDVSVDPEIIIDLSGGDDGKPNAKQKKKAAKTKKKGVTPKKKR